MPADTLNCTSSANETSCFGPLYQAFDNITLIAYELRGRLFGTILSTALFGTFALCTSITVLLIIRNLKLRKTGWAAWYTFATIAMFTSTSIYWAFILRDTFTIAGITTSAVNSLPPTIGSFKDCISDHGGECSSSEISPQNIDDVQSAIIQLSTQDLVLEYCVGTAALTTNIIIGDAIVLGRVYILWHRNWLVYLIFIILLLGTVATGVVSTTHACKDLGSNSGSWVNPAIETTGVGSLVGPTAGTLQGSFFEGDQFGLAASILSLATNAMSTSLIGYRVWEHRAIVRGNGLKSFLGRSQVSRALTLLVESGAVYSAIWIFVVVYQFIIIPPYIGRRSAAVTRPHSSAYRAFTAGWETFTEGGLVTVVAIYPTVIMLLAGLNRSECDNIASYRGNGRSEDAGALSVVFRGSVLVPAQPLTLPGASRPARQRASDEAASESSLSDLDMEDCSSERGYSSSVVHP